MNTPLRFSSGLLLILLTGALACREPKKKTSEAAATQDTMLLRDLAEANKNTAAANTVDNSLNTVRTSSDESLPAMVDAAAQSRTPETRVVTKPPSLVSGPTPGPQLPRTPETRVVTKPPSLVSRPRPVPQLRSVDSANSAREPDGAGTRSAQGAAAGDPCDSPTLVDQRSCLNRAILQNDAELNRTYQELLAQSRKSGGPGLEERLRQEQREWVNIRDSYCVQETSGQRGPLWARPRARCLAEHSAKRTAEFQRALNSLRGQ